MVPDAAGMDTARVLVCDDSRTFTVGFTRFLEDDPEIRVVKVVSSAEEALKLLASVQPDLVTMDLELPGMDGLEATKRILAEYPVPILVISSYTERGSELAAAALSAGAVGVMAKSDLRFDSTAGATVDAVRLRVKRLARLRAIPPRIAGNGASAPGAIEKRLRGRRASVIAIGASTGGPQALLKVLSMLPPDYRVPVMVVQHMSRGFTVGLARWLHQQVPIPVGVAEDGAELRRGVWFSPEDVHLMLDGSLRMSFDSTTQAGAHCPAADVLLRSVARAAGAGAVGVILTGMGRDGADGTAAVREAGGLTIAQDESSSVVWGMPRAAVANGAELVLPPDQIGAVLSRLGTRASAA